MREREIQLLSLARAVTSGDVPALNAAFRTQLVDWYLHRVYDELDGPLTDGIADSPPRQENLA